MEADTSQCVCDHLAIACDQLAESLVYLRELHPGSAAEGVEQGLLTLYKLRAELGFLGGQVVSDLVEEESEAAE